VDSGIIVSRGNAITFWHLTFQEYLAALALGGKLETDQQALMIAPAILHNPNWCEVILLFGGILYKQGKDKTDGFLNAVLNFGKQLPTRTLADEARCAAAAGCAGSSSLQACARHPCVGALARHPCLSAVKALPLP